MLIRSLIPAEKEVCDRLARMRRFNGVSQGGLAAQAGLTRSQLANIETGRTPLGFWQGWKLCGALNLSQGYLATGAEPPYPFEVFDPIEAASKPISESDTFYQVCTTKLAKELEFRQKAVVNKGPRSAERATTSRPEREARISSEEFVVSMASLLLSTFPIHQRPARFRSLIDQLQKMFIEEHAPKEWDQSELDSSKSLGKDYLDIKGEAATVTGMSSKEVPTWAQLKKTITSLTAARGLKTALAEELGVSRQVLSNWLSSEVQGAPNSELTLRLLKWSLDPKHKPK